MPENNDSTKRKKAPELIWMSDGSWVIAGVHLTPEEAEAQFGEEFRKESDSTDKITVAQHAWLRYEKIGEDDMDFEDIDLGTSLWILYETKKRPMGVTRAATVIA